MWPCNVGQWNVSRWDICWGLNTYKTYIFLPPMVHLCSCHDNMPQLAWNSEMIALTCVHSCLWCQRGNNQIGRFYFSPWIITHHLYVNNGKVSRKHFYTCILESQDKSDLAIEFWAYQQPKVIFHNASSLPSLNKIKGRL